MLTANPAAPGRQIPGRKVKAMWKDAKPIAKYWSNCPKSRKGFLEFQKRLQVVDYRMAEYGDWTLYRDDDGNLWEEYSSIGD